MRPRTVKLSGVAAGLGRVFRLGSRRFRLDVGAFDEWCSSPQSFFSPVLFGHDEKQRVKLRGLVKWDACVRNLKVSFHVDLTDYNGRMAALATECGFINGLSVGFEWQPQHASIEIDDVGVFTRVRKARVTECSLTDCPANPWAFVTLAGRKKPTRKVLPEAKSDRSALEFFLKLHDIDPTPTPVRPEPPTDYTLLCRIHDACADLRHGQAVVL
ncbi:MAG: hypothetical protein IT428_06715 [Planctomycetaceae bacterium]|nr:hypothetical protein [Planctomycetaceae bacterium]